MLRRNEEPEYSEESKHRIYLPFVIVNTDTDHMVSCQISDDRKTAEFTCTKPFELHDDRETLYMMQGKIDKESVKDLIPGHLLEFVRSGEPRKSEGNSTFDSPASAAAGDNMLDEYDDGNDVEQEDMDDDDDC
mmetsp:Transcript_23765/g.37151  ORF Transcript_23765/g.37151 Transcript_23765/m.37151 type:complete len:133 (-) Transcript_23765:75-473(-)